MDNWVVPYNFAVFFTAVYSGNSSLSQYEDVSILIDGIRLNQDSTAPKNTQGTDMANHYIRGRKAIGSKKVSAILALDEGQLVKRIINSGLYDRSLGAQCLYGLLCTDHLRIDSSVKTKMLRFPYQKEPERFLANMLVQAVRCPQAEITLLPKEVVQDILAYRQAAPKQDGNKEVSETPVVRRPIHGYYEAYELSYDRDREDFMEKYLKPKGMLEETMLSHTQILRCTDIFRRAAKTCVIDFLGSLPGLSDILLRRITRNQCMQILLMGQMHSEKEHQGLRPMLMNLARTALTADGFMHLSHSFDNGLEENEYRLRVIYSLAGSPEAEDERIQEIIKPRVIALTPRNAYEGRVPVFLLPRKSDR